MANDFNTPPDMAAAWTGTTPSPGVAATPNASDELGNAAHEEYDETVSHMRDRWLRAEAEMANVRSRAQRDVEDARQFAVQAFAKDVVEAAENLQRGIASLPARTDREAEMVTRLRDGFGGIERSFVSMLERHGIVRTDPTGTAFDANTHQAMDQLVSADHPPGTVLQAWTSAWTLNGRLLRPAMVVVSSAHPIPQTTRPPLPSYGQGG